MHDDSGINSEVREKYIISTECDMSNLIQFPPLPTSDLNEQVYDDQTFSSDGTLLNKDRQIRINLVISKQ